MLKKIETLRNLPNYPKLTSAARSLIQMTSFLTIDADNARLCYRCNMNYVNIIDHCLSECPYVHLERVYLWDKIWKEFIYGIKFISLTQMYIYAQELEVRSLYHLYSLKTKSSRCHYAVMTRSETKLSVAIPAPVSGQSAVNVA